MKKREVELCVEAFRDLYVNLRHIFFLYKGRGDTKGMHDARLRWAQLEVPAFGFYCMLHRSSGLDVGQLFGEFGMYLKKSYYACEHKGHKTVTGHKNVMVRAEEVIYNKVLGGYDNLIFSLVSDDEAKID